MARDVAQRSKQLQHLKRIETLLAPLAAPHVTSEVLDTAIPELNRTLKLGAWCVRWVSIPVCSVVMVCRVGDRQGSDITSHPTQAHRKRRRRQAHKFVGVMISCRVCHSCVHSWLPPVS
jgi:hypothetical protein